MDESEKLSRIEELAGTVTDPTFGKSLGALGSIRSVSLSAGGAKLVVRVSSASNEVREAIRGELETVLKGADFKLDEIEWDVQVPTREVLGDDPVPGVKNVILVMSGKGGVGKSTVAANLTLALRKAGMRVGLLDADMYGPSVPTMFGIEGRPGVREDKKIAPLERFGVKLMSIGFLLEDPKAAVVWRGPMLHGALQQFLGDVDWGTLDYLLLDLPPGTGDVALTLAQKLRVTGAVIVTTPQEVALQDVYKGVSMCRKVGIPILGVVENMSFFKDPSGQKHALFGEGGGEKVAQFSEAPLLGQVPIESDVRKWADDGTPIVQAAPNTDSAAAFVSIAEQLSSRVAESHFERGGGESAPKAEGPKRLRIVR